MLAKGANILGTSCIVHKVLRIVEYFMISIGSYYNNEHKILFLKVSVWKLNFNLWFKLIQLECNHSSVTKASINQATSKLMFKKYKLTAPLFSSILNAEVKFMSPALLFIETPAVENNSSSPAGDSNL